MELQDLSIEQLEAEVKRRKCWPNGTNVISVRGGVICMGTIGGMYTRDDYREITPAELDTLKNTFPEIRGTK